MQFLFQPLTWGFLLVGVPILIHLINMLRHRKQKWAAMEFLLESYRRNRRWVMLKQWILLAARMLVMLLLVAMLAKWVSNSQWLSWFGSQTTHHYVLLDDSYSMAERDAKQSAYNHGLQALSGLVRSIAGQPGQHQITLVRWSRAALANRNRNSEDAKLRIDAAADLIAQTVPRDPTRLLDRLNATEPTALQLSPDTPLELITPSILNNTDENAKIYLITDLRRNEFGEPEKLRNKLLTLTQNDATIQLIDCGQDSGNNLSITSLEPEQEVWAAGVPLMVRVQIRNQSAQPAKNLVVKIRTISYPSGAVTPQLEQAYSGQPIDLPPIVVEQIGAGEAVTRQVQVIFSSPGDHVVEATLPEDVLNVDNRRWCVIGIQQSQRVLLVDGDVQQSNAFYFETVVNPDSRLKTGMAIEKGDAGLLRDMPQEALNAYDVVALLDVPRIDDQAVAKLEKFCRDGGGLFFVCGRNTNINFVNESLYRDGEGIFPVELSSITEVNSTVGAAEPQVAATEHPILAPMLQLSSSPFFLLQIRNLLSPTIDSVARPRIAVVATGPGGTPLLLEHGFGEGRALAMLTGLTPDWSNWAQDPTFVVLALRSLGYLGSFRHEPASAPVSSSIEVATAGETMLPDAEIVFPARDQGMRLRLQRPLDISDNGNVSKLSLGIDLESMDRDLIDAMLRPGIFESWMVTGEGENRVTNFAHNVSAVEGDLSRIAPNELERKLQGIKLDIKTADAISGAGLNTQDAAHSTLLMAVLTILLLVEQLLAYSASYHAPRFVGATR